MINVDSINVDRVKTSAQTVSMASSEEPLTASEAAARLGIKRASLYAYVSRGLLTRAVALDGRSSLFDAAEVDELRSDRKRTARGEVSAVIASSITRLDEAGHEYRDRPVSKLIDEGLSFEQVCELLWKSNVDPTPWEHPVELLTAVVTAQQALPDATPAFDRLRVSTAVASALDPLRNAQSSGAFFDAGRRTIVAMAIGLSAAHGPTKRRPSGVAALMWPGLTRGSRRSDSKATPERIRALEVALILLADHGLAASTFGVRIATSVRADPYSIVGAGLGSMAGVLHGSASSAVGGFLERAKSKGPAAALAERFANNESIPGFGHVIYQARDPREALLRQQVERAWSDDSRLDLVRELRMLVADRTDQPANIDWALGAMAWLGNFGESSPGVMAVARTAGWIAHAVEEMGEQPLRFRPTARYVVNHLDPNRSDT